jgi:hypothetical protein
VRSTFCLTLPPTPSIPEKMTKKQFDEELQQLFSTGAKPVINDEKADICFIIDLQLVSNHKSGMNTCW